MLFNTFEFLGFFLVVYALYTIFAHRAQNVLLLLASYYFYACWDVRFLSLIVISTVVDYFCGIKIGAHKNKKVYVWISMVVNLGILALFKYFNFFIENMMALLGKAGFEANESFLKIALPVGISFYTFQTMSYSIDIYRGQLKPARNFLNFALFVAYFPQLVAGPIERAKRLLPQIENPRVVTYKMFCEGAWLILLGFFMKTVMADNLAYFVKEVFDGDEGNPPHGLQVILGIIAFAMQIYGDFGGYTNIARGISKWFGIELMLNFRMPYFSSNPPEFWRRWHISLSSWLRDYLYIPLGGNRYGSFNMFRNLVLTMLLGGLWHGAAWNYVAWGAYHGVLLVGHRLLSPILSTLKPAHRFGAGLWQVFCVACFFVLTLFGWVLFRIDDLSRLPEVISNAWNPWAWNAKVLILTLTIFCLPVVLLDALQEWKKDMMVVKRFWPPLRLAVYLFMFACIVMCSSRENHAFIYFKF